MGLADREMNMSSECMFSFEGGYLTGSGYAVEQEDGSYLRFILVGDGRLFKDGLSGKVLVSNSGLVTLIEGLRDEDRETLDARNKLARELAASYGGSGMAWTLFSSAIWFEGGDPGEGWLREDGASFWQVGRNSSHDFHMGVRKNVDGVTFFRGSYEQEWEDGEGKTRGGWEQNEVSEFAGYFGHA